MALALHAILNVLNALSLHLIALPVLLTEKMLQIVLVKILFFENGTADCDVCVFPCVNCLSLTDCTSCVEDANREDATLDCVCKAGHFEDE